MPTNVFFNNYQSSQEQLLIENLIIESIRMYGMDMYYMPKTLVAYDGIYGEDPLAQYNKPFFVEMYIKNVQGFEGDGDLLTKFNLEIRDRITFTISRRVFHDEVGASAKLVRPNEGDLIFFPINNKLYEIKFVEHEAIFYQLGSLQTFDLVCELFEYSGQQFNTGITAIDNIYRNFNLTSTNFGIYTEDSNPYSILLEDGSRLLNENFDENLMDPTADNDEIETESDEFMDFSEIDPFSEGGTF
jgi:hypothetical protein